ncbi:MAG: glutamate--tRNA ligase [Firmicutes bacterium]|nr:glutamate--tRNA ligase [Bacillota bacterium]
MTTTKIRTRFAPSPTGFLHVGGARTALFNWLYARHYGGTFVLRIEDTDLERSTEESVDVILEGMRWLGFDWDEGPGPDGDIGEFAPYFQSARLDIYKSYIKKLLDEDKAYPCYCTPEELRQRREASLARGEDPKYDRRCADLIQSEREALALEGRESVIRFRSSDEGSTVVNDLIHGEIIFDNAMLDDFVVLKSDGTPTYNFAVVIDDHLMEITHVIRGDDHISNTPRQIQVYEALSFPLPEFAHLPMILGSDKTRLSKRHGATSVTEYRDAGFVPEALDNYLALLGWSFSASDTLFTTQELIEKFTLERVSKNPAVFDMKKLEWMNGVYIREMPIERLTELVLPRLQEAELLPHEIDAETRQRVKQIASSLQSRLRTLADFVPSSRYFFTDEIHYDEAAVDEFLYQDHIPEMFEMLHAGLKNLQAFGESDIEQVFRGVQKHLGMKLGEVIQPVRVAITGTRISPGMYEVLAILGQERTCRLLENVITKVKTELSKA